MNTPNYGPPTEAFLPREESPPELKPIKPSWRSREGYDTPLVVCGGCGSTLRSSSVPDVNAVVRIACPICHWHANCTLEGWMPADSQVEEFGPPRPEP